MTRPSYSLCDNRRRGSPFAMAAQQYGFGQPNHNQPHRDPQLENLYLRSAAMSYIGPLRDDAGASTSASPYPHNGPYVRSSNYSNGYQAEPRNHINFNNYVPTRGNGNFRGTPRFNEQRRQQYQSYPTNHRWQAEYEPPIETQPEEFRSVGIVLWFNGACGEILCCRNLKQANVHYYFDGRTVFNGQPLAILNQEDSPLKAGTTVEFECFYKHPTENRDQLRHTLFHVKEINSSRDIPLEEHIVSVDPGNTSIASFRTAYDKDFHSVLIHHSIFTKDIIARHIQQGAMPFKMEPEDFRSMRSTLTRFRTVIGMVGTAPRWFNDVVGQERIVKKFMICCKPYEDIKEGEATIMKMYHNYSGQPSQAILRPKNQPDIFIPYSLFHLDARIRVRFQANRTVKFIACRELPDMPYAWRALDVSLPECEGDMIPPCSITSDYLEEGQIQPDLIDWDSEPVISEEARLFQELEMIRTPGASTSKSSHGSVSYMADLIDLQIDWSEAKDILNDAISPQLAANAQLSDIQISSQIEHEETSSTERAAAPVNSVTHLSQAGEFGYMKACGCSPYEERSYETCSLMPDYSDGFKFGDEPHNHNVIDARAEAKKKAKLLAAKLEEEKMEKGDVEDTKPATDEEWKPKNKFQLFVLEESQMRKDLEKMTNIPTTSTTGGVVVDVESNRTKSEPVAPSVGADVVHAPAPEICVIGVYDDISFVVGNRLKKQYEHRIIDEAYAEKKRETRKTNIPEPKKPKHDNGFWFRRKDPRTTPTVLVGEYINKRNRDLDMLDIDTNLLTKTVVIKNEITDELPFVRNDTTAQEEIIDPSPNVAEEELSNTPNENNTVAESSPVPNAVVQERVEIPVAPPENKLLNMLMGDKVFGSFFGTILTNKKNMN